MTHVLLREIQPDDDAEWVRMRCALWPHYSHEEHAVESQALFQHTAPATVFVCPRPEGGLQGFVEVGLRNYAEGCDTSPVGYIEGWYVDADVRQRGVGRALVAAAERWAWAQGCSEIASDAELSNMVSQTAHTQLGYTQVERSVHYKKRL